MGIPAAFRGFAVSMALTAPAAFAGQSGMSFSEKCPDIPSCARAVGALLDQKYIFDGEVKGQVFATPNTQLNAENAELLFTHALSMLGYSRVPVGQPGTFEIM